MDEILDDTQIINSIRSEDANLRSSAIEILYKNTLLRSRIQNYITAYGGTDLDFDDVFQDTIISFDASVRNGTFNSLESKISTYLIALSKRIFFTKKRSELRRTAIHDLDFATKSYEITDDSIEKNFIVEERRIILEKITSQLSDNCRDMLRMHSLGYPLKSIALEFNYSNIESAKMQVYRCKEYLKNYLKAHPHLVKMLKEL